MKTILYTYVIGVACMILVAMPTVARAYFSDSESGEAHVSAGTLSFSVSNPLYIGHIGDDTVATHEFSITNTGTHIPMHYLYALSTSTACSRSFYEALSIKITHDTEVLYEGTVASTTLHKDLSDMQITAEVSLSEEYTPSEGEKCMLILRADAYQQSIGYGKGGFTDTHDIVFQLGAYSDIGPTPTKSILFSEILANPSATSSASPYTGEYIELYNASDASIDMTGWQLSELTSSGVENRRTIVPACPVSGGSNYMVSHMNQDTVVAPGEYFVVAVCGSSDMLNNDGDTVRLYKNKDITLPEDIYTYTQTTKGMSFARLLPALVWEARSTTPGMENGMTSPVDVSGLFSEEAFLGTSTDDRVLVLSGGLLHIPVDENDGTGASTSTDPALLDPAARTDSDPEDEGEGDADNEVTGPDAPQGEDEVLSNKSADEQNPGVQSDPPSATGQGDVKSEMVTETQHAE